MNTLTLSQAREKLPKLIKSVDTTGDAYQITVKGRPAAILLSVDDYESLLETIEIMSNPELIADIKQAEQDLKEGKCVSLKDLLK